MTFVFERHTNDVLTPFLQVGLLNVDGYYNSLLALFDNGVEEGFIKPAARHIVVSAPNAKELLVKLEVIPLIFQLHSFLSQHFGQLILHTTS